MLRSDVARDFRENYDADGFLFPASGSCCFGNVPDTVRALLDADGQRPLRGDVVGCIANDFDTIILRLLDGYGLGPWRRDRSRFRLLDTVPATRETIQDDDVRCFDPDAALDSDLFGDRSLSDAFRRRLADLLLTHRNLSMWFRDVEPAELDNGGMHCGLEPAERLVPFAPIRLEARP